VDAFDDWEQSMQRLARQLSLIAAIDSGPEATPGDAATGQPVAATAAPVGSRPPARAAPGWRLIALPAAAIAVLGAGVWLWVGQPPTTTAPPPRTAASTALTPAPSPPASDAAASPAAKSATVRAELAARLALAVPRLDEKTREDRARGYEAALSHKAQAASPEPPGTWRSAMRPSAEEAEAAALEQCQIFHGQPCVLLAVNDTVQSPPKDNAWPRRDMPRARYAGT